MPLTWPKSRTWKTFWPFEAFPRYPWWGCRSPAAAHWCSCPGSPSPSASSCSSPSSAPGSGCPSASAGTRTPSCSRPPSASAPQSDLHNSESIYFGGGDIALFCQLLFCNPPKSPVALPSWWLSTSKITRKWGDIGQQIAHPNLHKVKLFISHIISLAGNSHNLPFQIEFLKVLLVF